MIALLAAAGLSTAVAATYLTFTADSSVGSFSPDGVPLEAGDTTTTSTPTTVFVETTSTTVTAPPAPTPTTISSGRPRTTVATTRATTRATAAPTTTTTECSNSGKGNCRSRGGKPDDD